MMTMAKNIENNPQLREQFIALIDAYGGDKCTNWIQVTDYISKNYGYKFTHPKFWKDIYTTLKKGKWNGFSLKQRGIAVVTIVKHRGNNRTAIQEYLQLTGNEITTQRFTAGTKQALQYSLQSMIKMLSLRKKTTLSGYKLQEYSNTIIEFLKIGDLTPSKDNQMFNELVECAKLFEQLLNCFGEHIIKIRPIQFSYLREICKRSQFERIIFYLMYIHEFKRIYQNKQDYATHALLDTNIQENFKGEIFERIIRYKDWDHKFELYNSSFIEVQPIKLQKKTALKIEKVTKEQPQIKTVRGRIKDPNRLRIKNPWTIEFQHEDEENEEQMPLQFLEQRNEKLQQLLDEAFRFDSMLHKKK